MGGDESFDVVAFTPLWLTEIVVNDGQRTGAISWSSIRLTWQSRRTLFVVSQIESFGAPDWPDTGAKLSRIGYREFEDDQP